MPEVQFRYLKSTHFRTIHVDGVLGVVGPQPGRIHLSLYVERFALPDSSTLEVSLEGTSTSIHRHEGTGDIVRELEASLPLDLPVAVQLHAFLGRLIQQALAPAPALATDTSEPSNS